MTPVERVAGRIAVIPARGGSRRVPGKNVRLFHERPAIAWTIEAAVDSGLFGRVIVSTDSQSIADISHEYGAEVPFLRAASLSDDHTPVSAATRDTVERLVAGGYEVDTVAQLMPNCPLRNADDVCSSFDQFSKTGASSQLSIVRFGWLNPWWAMRRGKGYELDPLFAESSQARSQDLADLFCPTGAIWWIDAGTLRREATFHVPGRTGWEMPWMRGVDIDTEDDWRMAEMLFQHRSVEAAVHG